MTWTMAAPALSAAFLASLVEARREGTTVYYSIVRPEILTVVQALHDAFCPPGSGKPPRSGPANG